jgi:two-component system, chemotaxis family, protein-glutamate methylesterase/glutaminase
VRPGVLVVDDSAVIRKVVGGLIDGDPDLELVGTASTGRIALARVEELGPDLLTLDLQMPDMDGLATLRELRVRFPQVQVVVLSSHTERGAGVTLDALAAGARDYVTKPSMRGSAEGAVESLRDELLPKLKRLARVPKEPRFVARPVRTDPALFGEPRLLVVGGSTGAIPVLTELLAVLPGDFPIPVAIVQHMPPLFTRHLAERLDELIPLAVREAVEGAALEAGQVWVAQGGLHLEVTGRPDRPTLRLHEGPRECSVRPAVDVLFRSAATLFGPGVLAVVLTGMGQDGLEGCRAVDQAGGQILVQDQASSVVWGMPGAVAEAGLADAILPADALGAAVANRIRANRARGEVPGA